jgi:hypothetical protein
MQWQTTVTEALEVDRKVGECVSNCGSVQEKGKISKLSSKKKQQTNKQRNKQTNRKQNKTKQKGLIQYIAFASECEAFYDSIDKANSVA